MLTQRRKLICQFVEKEVGNIRLAPYKFLLIVVVFVVSGCGMSSTTGLLQAPDQQNYKDGALKLVWNRNPENVDGYRVYYGSQPRDYTTVIEVIGGATEVQVEKLPLERVYFAVTAYIGVMESPYSDELLIDVDGFMREWYGPSSTRGAGIRNSWAGLSVSP